MSIEKDLINLLETHDRDSLLDILKNRDEIVPDSEKKVEPNIPASKLNMFDKIVYSMIVLIVIIMGFAFYLYTQIGQDEIDEIPYDVKQEYISKSKDLVLPPEVVETKELYLNKLKQLAANEVLFKDLPKDVQDKYILKSEIKKEKPKQKVMFENLPQEIQEQYIKKIDAQEQLQHQQMQYEDEIMKIQENSEKNVSFGDEETTPFSLITTKNRSKPFATFKCYDMATGSVNLTLECKNGIEAFVKTHKDKKYFEIIGVVDQSDIAVYENIDKTDNKTVEQYKKYTAIGLSQNRANEIAWMLRQSLGKDVTIMPVNYPVYSKKGLKGVIIHVYK